MNNSTESFGCKHDRSEDGEIKTIDGKGKLRTFIQICIEKNTQKIKSKTKPSQTETMKLNYPRAKEGRVITKKIKKESALAK